jgi:DNA-binding NarL/FixJ family response regulator
MEACVTVVVVDGNPGARQGLIRRLRQMPGISVVGEAGDPDEALRVVRDGRPDVVVTDLRRIDPNAAEFLGRMAATAPQAGIVILTAYLTEGERSNLMRAGARAILLKEIDSGTLVWTIRTVAAQLMPSEMRAEA